MEAERWEAVRAELERLLDLAPAQRAAALPALPPEIRSVAAQLLRAERASDALEHLPEAVRRRLPGALQRE